jgi:hypothetical protein
VSKHRSLVNDGKRSNDKWRRTGKRVEESRGAQWGRPGKEYQEPAETEEDFTILAQLSGNFFSSFVRVPKKATWAYFKAFIDHYTGEGE